MRIVCKKTVELSYCEIVAICNLFHIVFKDAKRSNEEFINEYSNNFLGYSYHVLLLNDNEDIVGAFAYIPFLYCVDGIKFSFALGADMMIDKVYRNFDNIFDIWSFGKNILQKHGFDFYFGFPNDNAYPLTVKGFKYKDIGSLTAYVLPYRISGIKPALGWLDFLSISFSRIKIFLSHFSVKKKIIFSRVTRDRDSFEKYRYQWFNSSDYHVIKKSDMSFAYKIKVQGGVKCAFLFDVFPMSPYNINKAVRILYRQRNLFSMIIYVGHLKFSPISLVKVPQRYAPKKFHFIGMVFDNEKLDSKVMYDINNWEIDLSSYDLI